MEIAFDAEVIVNNREVCNENKITDMAIAALSNCTKEMAVHRMFPNNEHSIGALHSSIAEVFINIEYMYAKGMIDPEAIQQWVNVLLSQRKEELYNGTY